MLRFSLIGFGFGSRRRQVYIDVLESVNLLMSSNGAVLRNDVSGKVIMKTLLSGTWRCPVWLISAFTIGTCSCATPPPRPQLITSGRSLHPPPSSPSPPPPPPPARKIRALTATYPYPALICIFLRQYKVRPFFTAVYD